MSAFTIEETPSSPRGRLGRSVRASCDVCDYKVWSWLPEGVSTDILTRGHAKQHEPGRAPDIDVDWRVFADCSVCEDDGNVQVDDEGDLECTKCRTYWSIDGTGGTRREGGASDE